MSGARPAVIRWFRLWALANVVIYTMGFLASLVSIVRAHATSGAIAVIGLVALGFATFYLVAARAPYRPAGWALGLVAICIGVTGFLFVFAIPLLVYWTKPTTKAAFGRL